MMARVRCKAYVCGTLLVMFVVILNVYRADKLTIHKNINVGVSQWRNFTTTEHINRLFAETTAANVILPTSFKSHNESIYCISVSLMKLTFPICIYDPKSDKAVSGGLMAGKYWEKKEVSRFLQLFRLDRRLQLVDIGANVGLHSLPAARVTQVISVEPNWLSMARLAKAVYLDGKVSSNITLVHNAISNIRATLMMGAGWTNQAHAFLMNKTTCRGRCSTVSRTKTILLDDLLSLMRSEAAILKVDVEGHEDKVFTELSAAQFFNRIDVPLVFMEWNVVKEHSVHNVHRLINFFYNRGYTVFDTENERLTRHYRTWPTNVLFKKLPLIRF